MPCQIRFIMLIHIPAKPCFVVSRRLIELVSASQSDTLPLLAALYRIHTYFKPSKRFVPRNITQDSSRNKNIRIVFNDIKY